MGEFLYPQCDYMTIPPPYLSTELLTNSLMPISRSALGFISVICSRKSMYSQHLAVVGHKTSDPWKSEL